MSFRARWGAAIFFALLALLIITNSASAWEVGDGVRYRKVEGPVGPHRFLVDTDRKVAVHRYCDYAPPYYENRTPTNTYLAFVRYRYVYDSEGRYTETEAEIWINRCYLNRLHYSAEQRERVKEHEIAHALGWMHWEGSPLINAAYYP
jgi:hypothetical protein